MYATQNDLLRLLDLFRTVAAFPFPFTLKENIYLILIFLKFKICAMETRQFPKNSHISAKKKYARYEVVIFLANNIWKTLLHLF